LDRFGRTPETDAERLYAEGWKAERFDDPVTARQRYEAALAKADVSDTDQRAYATLARQGLDRIKSAAAAQARLKSAVQLLNEGKADEARKQLTDIVSLYGADQNQDVSQVVAEARNRLAELYRSAPK
jgi:hypothetical protein